MTSATKAARFFALYCIISWPDCVIAGVKATIKATGNDCSRKRGNHAGRRCARGARRSRCRAAARAGGGGGRWRRGYRPRGRDHAARGDRRFRQHQRRPAPACPTRLHPIDEQDSTDFEKCLARVRAACSSGWASAARGSTTRWRPATRWCAFPAQRCVLLGEGDLMFLCPPVLSLPLAAGCRVSLFPMGAVRARPTGSTGPSAGSTSPPTGGSAPRTARRAA